MICKGFYCLVCMIFVDTFVANLMKLSLLSYIKNIFIIVIIIFGFQVAQYKMKVKKIQPLKPHQRAIKLGLDPDKYKPQNMRQETTNVINFVKKKDRSNLKLQQWKRKEYHNTDATFQLFNCPDEIQRISMNNLSVQQFVQKYQKTSTPVVIKGCADTWKIQQRWNHAYFMNTFANSKFKVGQDDDGYKIRVPFHNYIEYLLYNQDDSPLYLFQSALEEKVETKQVLENYQIPPYFRDDLFKLAGEQKRPPYRWFIMGPERSGTTIHTDPLYTSAWNTSLCGHKRWVVFGENMPKSIVKGKQFRIRHPVYKDDEAINFFVQILPRIVGKYSREELQIREFIQYPGETVFIPGGIWHAVINLDDTIAVTQNVMTRYCFDKVWRSTRSQRRKFAETFLQKLATDDTELYDRAIDMNTTDGYTMGQKYAQQQVSLSFTPYSSSSSSSSSSESNRSSEHNQSSFSIEDKPKQFGNRVNLIHRSFKHSSRSSSSQGTVNRSRQKNKRTIFSEEKKPNNRSKLKQTTSSASDS